MSISVLLARQFLLSGQFTLFSAIFAGEMCLITCGSHISCGILGIVTSHTNAGPKCASRVQKLASPESVFGCNRGGLRYSQPAWYAPQTWWKNWRHDWLRTSDIHQSSLTPVISELDPIVMKRGGMKYECSRTQRDMLWCENERSYVLCDMPWCENECSHVPTRYVLVCKMYVHICYTIWSGVINDCLHVLHEMLWCENECSHVPTRYVMVCKMYVRVCYTIWVSAIDKLLETFVLALKQTRVAKKRNRKCALVLTLLIR